MKFTFNGQLIQQTTKCTSKIKAREVESAFRHELVLGRIGIKAKVAAPRFNEAVKDFLEWSKVNHASKPNSYKRVKYSCEALKKFFGKTKVDRVEPKDVEKFVMWRVAQTSQKTKESISRDTVNLELIALKSIFKRLVSQNVLSKNPCVSVKQLPENERRFHVLSRDDEKRYLLACPQPLQDVANLMIETGMRPSEIYHLTREHIFIEQNCLDVIGGKTKSSNRRIWLTDKASNVLRLRLERFTGQYLFPQNDVDGAKPTHELNDQHRTARKRIGMNFRLYDLRHTFASRQLERGTDLLTISHLLGHSSLDQVMRYAHVNKNQKREAVRSMNEAKKGMKTG